MIIPEDKTLQELFEWRFDKTPLAVAHKFEDRETTYEELNTYSNQIANGLIELGCKPDTRIAYYGKNSDYFFEFLIGTLKSSTVTVGVNWRLAPPEVAYIINDSKSEVLLVGPEFFGLIEEIKNDIPSVKKIITVGGSHEEWEDYVSWRDSHEDVDPMLESKGDDDVIQLYTSGTTGHPKGVQLSNDNFSSCFLMNEDSMYREMDEGEINLVCMPIFHVAGTNMGLAGMVTGAKNIIIPEVDPTLILKLIEQENRFLAEKSELASAEIVNSCLESVNMLRESHRALMANNTDLRNELESVKLRYKTESNRWRNNFEELRKVYESRLEYESTTATTMGVGSNQRKR